MDTATSWTMPGPGWLFCPADRPERYAKAAAAADVVILDLEDAVSPDAKAGARQSIVDDPQDVERTVVRVVPKRIERHRDQQARLTTLDVG